MMSKLLGDCLWGVLPSLHGLIHLYNYRVAVLRWVPGCSYNQGLPAVGRAWAPVPDEGRRVRELAVRGVLQGEGDPDRAGPARGRQRQGRHHRLGRGGDRAGRRAPRRRGGAPDGVRPAHPADGGPGAGHHLLPEIEMTRLLDLHHLLVISTSLPPPFIYLVCYSSTV